MIIDFRNAVEMDIYPIESDVTFDEDILKGYYQAEFTHVPHAKGWYVLTDNKLTVNVTLSVDILFICDRCLEPVPKHFDIKVAEVYINKDEADTDCEFVYDKSIVDISDLFRERLLLAIPIGILCKEDCKGLCQKCGTNLNYSKCDCKFEVDEPITENNPFAKLKDFNTDAGGANNGSTKG